MEKKTNRQLKPVETDEEPKVEPPKKEEVVQPKEYPRQRYVNPYNINGEDYAKEYLYSQQRQLLRDLVHNIPAAVPEAAGIPQAPAQPAEINPGPFGGPGTSMISSISEPRKPAPGRAYREMSSASMPRKKKSILPKLEIPVKRRIRRAS